MRAQSESIIYILWNFMKALWYDDFDTPQQETGVTILNPNTGHVIAHSVSNLSEMPSQSDVERPVNNTLHSDMESSRGHAVNSEQMKTHPLKITMCVIDKQY